MKQIRRGVFETNSSSTHSIAICTVEEFRKFKDGDLVYNDWKEELIPADSEKAAGCYTWYSFCSCGMETYVKSFITPSGDNMVAFGYYGYDG